MGNTETRKKAASIRQAQIHAKEHLLALQETARPQFIADVMLGRLAKWLRIAGFDVLYSNKFTDDELVSLSNREKRILLSRDTRLLVRKSVKDFIFLESQNVQDQIKQILETTQTAGLPSLLTRCLACNDVLIETTRESVRTRVPKFVYETQMHFKCCPKCQRIFWAGTHRKSVIRTFEKILSSSIRDQA
jgi:uncharacterized protein with PIN domain